jgi:hypothetical protein
MNKNPLSIILYLALGLQLSIELNPLVAKADIPTFFPNVPIPPDVIGSPKDTKPAGTLVQLPKPRTSGGIPPYRKPAGTRGPCEETTLPFTPVLPLPKPVSRNTDPEFSGATVASHPTFWFYVPYNSDRVKSGRFSVETIDDGMRVWRTEFKLPPTPGFVSVRLPQSIKGLEEGQTYRWYFNIYCNSEADAQLSKDRQPSIVYHHGLVKRAKKTDLPAFSKHNSLDFYLKHKLWYDAANQLTEVRKSPQRWNSFLAQMDMSQWQEEKISGALY